MSLSRTPVFFRRERQCEQVRGSHGRDPRVNTFLCLAAGIVLARAITATPAWVGLTGKMPSKLWPLSGEHETASGQVPSTTPPTKRHAFAEPPVVTRPPDVDVNVEVRKSEWTECLINDPKKEALSVETWVFRTQDYSDFEKFLKIRGYQNLGQQASLTCRERAIDSEVRCAECVRLLRGGYYGNLGVSVPAFPPQSDAIGCIALSKAIDMPPPNTEEDDSGDWDGDEGRQTAFCNSVKARFENVDA